MLNVHFTVDVEVWLGGWTDLDTRFADAFNRYIYGPTKKGPYGLTRKLQILTDHGLKGIFFVEPLFATRFGIAPLQEIVGLIQEQGHDVQLHLHTEWVDEAREPLLSRRGPKRPYLSSFSPDEQIMLVGAGKELLSRAGAAASAFRAGSFAVNHASLAALRANSITIDSSYNPTNARSTLERATELPKALPFRMDGVLEFPLTVYNDRPNHLRQLQLGSCTFAEMQGVILHALQYNWSSIVILSHNFELLNQQQTGPDDIVDRRFRKLARFLESYRDSIRTGPFEESQTAENAAPDLYCGTPYALLHRHLEQGTRRVFYR